MRPFRYASLLAAAALLGGCESVSLAPPPPADDPVAAFEARRARLASVDTWTANGRLAVRVPDDSWSARVTWAQDADHYEIRLSGPLGQGAAEIAGRPGTVTLRTADNMLYTASTPEDLIGEHLGWDVPLDGLRHWMLGRPQPDVEPELVELDAAGRLQRLEQAGWVIEFKGYGEFDDLELPTRLDFQNRRFSGKLAVSNWIL